MRPIRDLQESLTAQVPKGPLGVSGKGNLVGLTAFAAVTIANNFSPIPVGYDIQATSVNEASGTEVHKVKVWSASKDLAKVVAVSESIGTNANILSDKSEVTRVKELKRRTHHSLYVVNVEVDRKTGEKVSEGEIDV